MSQPGKSTVAITGKSAQVFQALVRLFGVFFILMGGLSFYHHDIIDQVGRELGPFYSFADQVGLAAVTGAWFWGSILMFGAGLFMVITGRLPGQAPSNEHAE